MVVDCAVHSAQVVVVVVVVAGFAAEIRDSFVRDSTRVNQTKPNSFPAQNSRFNETKMSRLYGFACLWHTNVY